MVYHCIYNSYLQWLFLLSFLTAMKILLFLHFIYSLCLFFNLIKALAAHFLCPQTTFFGTKLDLLKNKNKSPNIITETITSTDLTVNFECNSKHYTLFRTMKIWSRENIFSCFEPLHAPSKSYKFI